jgi:pimeloyl-ACP methyl ester carboxylesterase
LVRRLVLVNTFAYFPRRAYIGLLSLVGPYLPASPSHPLARPIRGVLFFSPDVQAEDKRRWWDLTADVPMCAFGRRFELIRDLDLRPQLREIRMPTLVLAAPNDHVVPPVAGRLLAQCIPGAKLIEPPAGHAAMVHPRVDMAELIARFG